MTRTQACEPCAKRKVRCDKQEPCNNCTRRKQDHCSYVDESPYEKIKSLEEQVRKLQGSLRSDGSSPAKRPAPSPPSPEPRTRTRTRQEATATVASGRSKDPVIFEEDGQQFYLESQSWHAWFGHEQESPSNRTQATGNPFLIRNAPNAFQRIFYRQTALNLAERDPPSQDAAILWNVFSQGIHPVLRISFSSDYKRSFFASTQPGRYEPLTEAEHIFKFTLYLITVLSLSDEECVQKLHHPKSSMVSQFQTIVEEALSHTNIFCVNNVTILKALTVYLMSGIDRLSTQSLWSLMGLINRNAEKLGVHRDGTLLKLPPMQTEERRRLWWHLQHLDLALAVRSGMTPLTLMGDWDAKLPLNIEDEDIDQNMTEPPKERKGLTSMSYCLFTYWVIDKQRGFLRANNDRFELSWQSKEAVPPLIKDSLIDQLEEGVNKHFLQHCDPLKPVHVLIQIVARALVCGMRQRTLQPLASSKPAVVDGERLHRELIDASIQSLEYSMAYYTQPSIAHFQWLTRSFFPWHAFMIVLVEASQQSDLEKSQRIWDLLSALYSINLTLSQFHEDRRISHAAELVSIAWRTCERRSHTIGASPKPDFVMRLETQLEAYRRQMKQGESEVPTENLSSADRTFWPSTPETMGSGQDANAMFDLDFQDIDWSFWSSID
ncbi:MAG: hypothetical protein Q9183_002569 [Haloplaca sp. 2 TL-2023]